jgi:hypothetical protein
MAVINNSKITVLSIAGQYTTVGTGEEAIPLSVDGAVAVAAVPVADGTQLTISDWTVCAPAASFWRLEQSNDAGATWFNIAIAATPGSTVQATSLFNPKTGWVVVGGAMVQFRVTVQSAAGGTVVNTVVRSYIEG